MPSSVTRRVGLINNISNRKLIRRKMEIEILRETMGFTILTTSGCAYLTRVLNLISHTPLASMIHGTT